MLICSGFIPPLRSLFSIDLEAGTTTHVEEPLLRGAGLWQLLTVWTGDVMFHSLCILLGCMRLWCIFVHSLKLDSYETKFLKWSNQRLNPTRSHLVAPLTCNGFNNIISAFFKYCSSRTWRVVLGEHDLYSNSGREQIIGVSKVYIHPRWNSMSVSAGWRFFLFTFINVLGPSAFIFLLVTKRKILFFPPISQRLANLRVMM